MPLRLLAVTHEFIRYTSHSRSTFHIFHSLVHEFVEFSSNKRYDSRRSDWSHSSKTSRPRFQKISLTKLAWRWRVKGEGIITKAQKLEAVIWPSIEVGPCLPPLLVAYLSTAKWPVKKFERETEIEKWKLRRMPRDLCSGRRESLKDSRSGSRRLRHASVSRGNE